MRISDLHNVALFRDERPLPYFVESSRLQPPTSRGDYVYFGAFNTAELESDQLQELKYKIEFF